MSLSPLKNKLIKLNVLSTNTQDFALIWHLYFFQFQQKVLAIG